VLVSLAAIAVLVIMSMLVYLMISLRGMPQRAVGGRPAATPQHRVVMGPAGPGRGSAAPAKPVKQ
jgi:hypothetical protein